MNKTFAHNLQLETDITDVAETESTKHNNNASFFSSVDSKVSSRSVYPRPTVLNVGLIRGMRKKGSKIFSAQRVTKPVLAASESDVVVLQDDDDLDYDCVELKIGEAIRLKNARELGLERSSLMLTNYSKMGVQYVIKELVKSALRRKNSGTLDCTELVGKIRSFAAYVDADFDDAVHQYAQESCDSNRDNIPNILRQMETLSCWCTTPSVRCLIVLKMLRKALVSIQPPPNLTALADEAITWAADGDVKSEVEEAARLLSIDALVRKYCGNGAQEFFRVNDPTHGIRLVQYVCRHIDLPEVLDDAFVLCDAFSILRTVKGV